MSLLSYPKVFSPTIYFPLILGTEHFRIQWSRRSELVRTLVSQRVVGKMNFLRPRND